ncbi:hypothetical protein E2C01_015811 [Portunus trituberculatus]|uniref:Uncharacterized protein n=1 Tax=Portunus trituberculatus TaxID=210409 RepID=A0A5B7DNL6_PORTR|nr:hypothetical protein [Portunus trituberculatus]
MWSVQFRLRSEWSSSSQGNLIQINWTPDNLADLQWWTMESNLLTSRDLLALVPDFLLYTGPSTQGWGSSLLHYTAGRLWSEDEVALHISVVELRAVQLTLLHFQHIPQGKTIFRLPAFVSLFPDPMAIAVDAFLFPWDYMDLYAFSPLLAIRQLLFKLRSSRGTSIILIALFWPCKECFLDLLLATVDTTCLLVWTDIVWQSHFHHFHASLLALRLTAWELSSNSLVIKAIPEELLSSWRDLDGVQPL